ncbi:MAG: glycosyltransferase [Polaribacter sp.]|nr:glycosyltransferase [Polaribacter sp.]
MPVFDNLKGLKITIQSIQNQTLKDFEVWIIDGNSSEQTQEYLKTQLPPFYFLSEKDDGIYDAMNKGILKSKGEWLFFLGSGDVFSNDAVLANVFSSINKGYSLVSGKIIYSGNTRPFIYSKRKTLKKPTWSSAMWLKNGLHHQGTFYRRKLFLETTYNLTYKILSDYWFHVYLYKKKIPCQIVDLLITNCNSDGVSKKGQWKIYQEEISLKTDLSSVYLAPLFYILSIIKYSLRKMINVL